MEDLGYSSLEDQERQERLGALDQERNGLLSQPRDSIEREERIAAIDADSKRLAKEQVIATFGAIRGAIK